MHQLPAIAAALRVLRLADLSDCERVRREALRRVYRACGEALGAGQEAMWWRFGTWTTRN